MKSLMKTVPERILEQTLARYQKTLNPLDWLEYCQQVALLAPDIAADRAIAAVRDGQSLTLKAVKEMNNVGN